MIHPQSSSPSLSLPAVYLCPAIDGLGQGFNDLICCSTKRTLLQFKVQSWTQAESNAGRGPDPEAWRQKLDAGLAGQGPLACGTWEARLVGRDDPVYYYDLYYSAFWSLPRPGLCGWQPRKAAHRNTGRARLDQSSSPSSFFPVPGASEHRVKSPAATAVP